MAHKLVYMSEWTPESWRAFNARQQPIWPDPGEMERVLKELRQRPPLIFAGEARNLQKQLAAVSRGEAFLLQAGDCAESFEASADSIRDRLKVILQMAVIMTYSTGVPVVKVGRIAGQFAKPRSAETETIDEVELPTFRGPMVNDTDFTYDGRTANPGRLLTAYDRAAATLNLLRAFTQGGYAGLSQVHAWNQEFVATSPAGQRYEEIAGEIDRALQFMAACGVSPGSHPDLETVDFYTSHEALILGYEEALTRRDSLTDAWFDCSAHMVWIGERTRQLDGAHMEFMRGIGNPIGCKIGPGASPDQVLAICEALNPDRIPGRLTLITRMGSDKISQYLPPILETVRDAGHPVVWVSDPMHGNTFVADDGRKTRHFEDVLTEIKGFFAAHDAAGTIPGGIHIELTGDDVTECLGGTQELDHTDLKYRYETTCDPRLNGTQSIDLAFRVAELIRH